MRINEVYSMMIMVPIVAFSIKSIINQNLSNKVGLLELDSLLITQIPESPQLIIYGNINTSKVSGSSSSTCIYELTINEDQINLQKQSFQDSLNNNLKVDNQSCSTYSPEHQFIIFYIKNTKSGLNQLWTYTPETSNWFKLVNNGPQLIKCFISSYAGNIYVMGLSKTEGYFKIFAISLESTINEGEWKQVNMKFRYGYEQVVTLWNSEQFKTVAVIQPNKIQDNSQQIILESPKITTTVVCVQKISDYLLIVSKQKTYTYTFSTQILDSMSTLPQINSSSCALTSENQSQWLFILNIEDDQQQFYYFNINDFLSFSSIHLQSIQGIAEPDHPIYFFVKDDNLYLLLNQQIIFISKDCNQDYLDKEIQECFYSKIFCIQGYRGENCKEKQCANTLRIFDAQKNTEYLYECQGNGECKNGSCQCSKYWRGEDCSIYERKQCYGQLLYSWPVMNCECLQQTLGGNSCEVVFCYNDCSNHGICKQDGNCRCNPGYIGEDCSIIIIDFPGVYSMHDSVNI